MLSSCVGRCLQDGHAVGRLVCQPCIRAGCIPIPLTTQLDDMLTPPALALRGDAPVRLCSRRASAYGAKFHGTIIVELNGPLNSASPFWGLLAWTIGQILRHGIC